MLGMGLSLFPILHNNIQIKQRKLLFIGIFIASFITFGVLTDSNEGSESNLDEILEDFMEERSQDDKAFQNSLETSDPAEVLALRYHELLNEYGEYTGSTIKPMAQFVSNETGLSAAQLNYIQHVTGTMGLQTLINLMDQQQEGISYVASVLNEYHDLNTYNQSSINASLSSQTSEDQANEILALYANVYKTIYGTKPSLNVYKETKIAEVLNLSTLNKTDLEIVISYHLGVNRIFELFPEDLPNKEALIEIVSF